jgi:ketosteroid isomerase-like protein
LVVLRRAFEGVSAADADQMLANYTEDMILEMPYSDPPVVIEGREKARRYLRAAFKVFKFRLSITDVHETNDPDKLVVEYVSEGRVERTGKPYANVYIGVYWFRDGALCRVKEFFNPTVAAGATSAD